MGLTYVNVDQIALNPNNPRKNFDEESLKELADSIREHGIIQPLVVKYAGLGEGGELKCRLICGERRLRAAKMIGLDKVPVVYRVVDDEELSEAAEALKMLVENLQREDLDPIEEAAAYQRVLDEFGYTQEELAQQVGKSQGHIANRIRLMDLPETVKENISRGIISASHGKVLAGHRNLPDVVLTKAAKVIAGENIPVSRAANEVYKAVAEHGRALDGYEVKFKKDECKDCGHKAKGARWGGDPTNEFCLKHQCYDKKQEEAIKAEEEALAKKLAKVIKEGQKVVKLDDLGYGNYEDLNVTHGTKIDKTECAECEHRGFGVTSYDSKPKEVCLKPSCYRKKKGAVERAKNKETRDAFQVELGQIAKAIVSVGQARDYELNEYGMVVIDKVAMVYIAAQILANVDLWHDRKMTLYQYMKNKFGWDHDVLKRGAWGLLQNDWDTFRPLLERLDELQLLEVIMEWPAVARGLKGAEGWFLQQVPETTEPAKKLPEESSFDAISVVTGRVKRCMDCTNINEDRICSAFGFERVSLTSPQRCQHYKLRGDVEIESIPKTIEQAAQEPKELPARRYLDKNGRTIFVSEGLWSSSGEKEYGTFWQSASGGNHRVKTQAMPMVGTWEEAQRNLDTWAEKNGLQPVEPEESKGVA